MSNTYASIVSCADRIAALLGPTSVAGVKVVSSGRLPKLPEVHLEDLLVESAVQQIDHLTRSRLAAALHKHFSSLRSQLSGCWHTAEQPYSLKDVGFGDFDLESRLIDSYEARYYRCIDQVREILAKILARDIRASDSRSNNTRGGFSDVSPPHITQANKFSKPSESSKQHSTTQNPPSQPKSIISQN
jgi:hypothetical protein